MRFTIKLLFLSTAAIASLALADTFNTPHTPHNNPISPSFNSDSYLYSKQPRFMAIKTNFKDPMKNNHAHKSKRMSPSERHQLRNQIKEAGHMNFYRQ